MWLQVPLAKWALQNHAEQLKLAPTARTVAEQDGQLSKH